MKNFYARELILSLAAIGALTGIYAGCAMFQKATDDIPGTVITGLTVAACVASVQANMNLDTLAKENAIGDCVKAGFDKLTESDKRALLALPPVDFKASQPRKLDPSPYETGK